MTFIIPCECGKTIGVSASQAGGEAICECGTSVRVPSLRELKQSHEAGIVGEILHKVTVGELPGDDRCVVSGEMTDDVMSFEIQYGFFSRTREGLNPPLFILACLLSCGLALLLLLREWEKRESGYGEDKFLEVPVRVRRDLQPKVAKMWQWRLRHLLRKTPEYAELLKQHRDARITPLSHVE